MSTTDSNTSNSMRWKDCQAIHSPPEEIVAALQDEGKLQTSQKKGKEVLSHRFPAVEKLAGKLHSNLLKQFPHESGLTKNTTRGKKPLFKEIILNRRYVDVCKTDAFFHQCGKDGKGY